jgi:toxin-antitoxin system PIN domain toxin
MHLLDINVWLAMAFRRHVSHATAATWFQAAPGQCFFCRLTQMGFLRLASNPSAMGPAAVSMADAWRAYDALFSDPKVAFIDEPAGTEARWRFLTQPTTFTPKVWNDAYLAAFAELAGLEVVTFDKGFSKFTNVRCHILP